jgi:hypothetical protein
MGRIPELAWNRFCFNFLLVGKRRVGVVNDSSD